MLESWSLVQRHWEVIGRAWWEGTGSQGYMKEVNSYCKNCEPGDGGAHL